MSQVSHITKRYRRELAAREAMVEYTLKKAHTHMLASIQPYLNKLYREIEAAQIRLASESDAEPSEEEDGEAKIPLSWLYEGNRLPSLLSQIEEQIKRFEEATKITAGHMAHVGKQLGSQAAQEQVKTIREGEQ